MSGVLEDGRPYTDIIYYLPADFFHKSVNEPFIQKIMSIVLERKNWVSGNPNIFEPDYFCDGIPFEFTIASDKKRKNNFVQRYRFGKYTSEDVDTDIFNYIQQALKSKSEKKYAVPNVHLCVLCLIDGTSWVFDEYGSTTYHLVDGRRKAFFSEIRYRYINSEIFKNIFIIFPDMTAKWWVWDVLTNHRSSVQLLPSHLMSKKVPFIIEQSIFDKITKTFIVDGLTKTDCNQND